MVQAGEKGRASGVEIARLKTQIEQMTKEFRLEMRIAGGALQACREEALKVLKAKE